MPLGQMMGEWPNSPVGAGGWVHDVSFNYNGTRLAWVSCLFYNKTTYSVYYFCSVI